MGDIALALFSGWFLMGFIAELFLLSLRRKKIDARRYLIVGTIARMLTYSTCLVGGGHGVMILPTGLAIAFFLFRFGEYQIAPYPELLFVLLIFIFPAAIKIFTDSPPKPASSSEASSDTNEQP